MHLNSPFFGDQTIAPCGHSEGLPCIEAPVMLDRLLIRKSATLNIALSPLPGNYRPSFRLKGTDHYRIAGLYVLSSVPVKSHVKKVDLLIVIRYDLIYSDCEKELIQQENACFVISIDKIQSADCSVKRFEKDVMGDYASVRVRNKAFYKAEAMAQTFGQMICPETGALIIDLGAFFVIKSMCFMQLLVASVLGGMRFPDEIEAKIHEKGENPIELRNGAERLPGG